MADSDDATLRVALAPLLGPAETPDPVAVERALTRIRVKLLGGEHTEIRLSRFTLLRQLGRGGMGIVFAAHDPVLERNVAIKLLRTRGSHQEAPDAADARLLREARMIAKISHPNVVCVHDFGTYAASDLPPSMEAAPHGGVFIVMELVEGSTLADWLRSSPRSEREIARVFVAVGRGLQAAHDLGIVHRDLKPSNVMLADDGRVRVLDFGLARGVDGSDLSPASAPHEAPSARSGSDSITRTGTTIGTPAYMAPEQDGGVDVGVLADQYAYCVALFESLAGRRPFAGETADELRESKQMGLPRGRAQWPREIPAAWIPVLTRGLNPDPARRFPSMSQLVAAVEHVAGRWRRRAYGGLAAMGLVGVAAGAVAIGHAPSSCPSEAREQVGAVWSPAIRDVVERGMKSTGVAYAETTWRSVEERVEAYAEALVHANTESCELQASSSEGARALGLAQGRCAERSMRSLAALLDVLTDADERSVLRAVQAVDGLPPPADCAQARPDELEVVERDPVVEEALGRELAEFQATLATGHVAEARPLAAALVEHAEVAEHHGTLGYAHFGNALIECVLGEHEAALEDFERAYEAALASGNRRFAVRIQASLAQELVTGGARHDEARRLLRLARADLEGLGATPVDVATLSYAQGIRALQEGDGPAAVEAMREAFELREAHLGPERDPTIAARVGFANALQEVGDYEAAHRHYQATVEIVVRTLGELHPHAAVARGDLAQAWAALGDHDRALEEATKAREIFRAGGLDDARGVATLEDLLATIKAEIGDVDGAIVHRRRALELRTKALGPAHPDVGISNCHLGIDLNRLGSVASALDHATIGLGIVRESLGETNVHVGICLEAVGTAEMDSQSYALARGHLEAARDVYARHFGANAPVLASPLRKLARLAVSEGDSRRAVALLEEVVSKQDDRAFAGHRLEHALALFELAQLIDAENPARALELATSAQRELGALGSIGARHDEVRGWLRQRTGEFE